MLDWFWHTDNGMVPENWLECIVATSNESRLPSSWGIGPVMRLFSTWKNDNLFKPEMIVGSEPVSSLSFRSNWRKFVSRNSSVGRLPRIRLKFKSICSRMRIWPKCVGMVPVIRPSSNKRNFSEFKRDSSDGSVPANSLRSIHTHGEKMSELETTQWHYSLNAQQQ